jgi:hypothetical protein
MGDERFGGPGQEEEGTARLVGCRRHEVPVGPGHLGTRLRRPQQEGGGDEGQRVQPEGERDGDAEVAPAAVKGPEQLGVLVVACPQGVAVGGDQLDGNQVVASETELALEPT